MEARRKMLEERPAGRCPPGGKTSAWPLWALCILILCVIFGFMWANYTPVEPIADKKTLCPSKITAVAAVIIDVTDPLTQPQQDRIVNEMRQLCQAVPQYGRLDLYVLDKGMVAESEFSMCNPGDGAGKNAFASNDRISRLKWERLFFARVEGALRKAMTGQKSDFSPIVEAINDVAGRSFTSGLASNAHTLIIVSDMLHKTTDLNQYTIRRGALDFPAFSNTPYYRATRPTNLAGVRTQIFYVRRPDKGHLQTPEHKLFWRALFRDCGATADIAEI